MLHCSPFSRISADNQLLQELTCVSQLWPTAVSCFRKTLSDYWPCYLNKCNKNAVNETYLIVRTRSCCNSYIQLCYRSWCDQKFSQLPSALFARSLDFLVYCVPFQFGVGVLFLLSEMFPDYTTLSVLCKPRWPTCQALSLANPSQSGHSQDQIDTQLLSHFSERTFRQYLEISFQVKKVFKTVDHPRPGFCTLNLVEYIDRNRMSSHCEGLWVSQDASQPCWRFWS